MKYLIIGAGPCGLAMARSLQAAGIAYEQVEADAALGGNWLHGVYSSVYTDACKDVMQYPDFPMPADYPDFLSQPLMLEYLNCYADHHGLRRHIRFDTKVVWVEAIAGNHWQVHFAGGAVATYTGVIICNGHHWDRRFPDLQGSFAGEYFHSKDYKHPDQLRNKKVLVIGSGNSAADIACEAARVGSLSVMSMRDSPWIFPKSFRGIPLGRMKLRNAPGFLDPLLIRLLLHISFGHHKHYGLPVPRHKPFEKHPTVSEELPYYLRHGRITVKPGVARTADRTVWFADGTALEVDVVVAATGFRLSFPFLPPELARTEGQNLHCTGHCVFPDYKGLYFLGWQQVRGGVGTLAAAFSGVIANLIRLEETYHLPAGRVFAARGMTTSSTHLYGAKDIYRWIGQNSYPVLEKAAQRLSGRGPHQNVPTPGLPSAHLQALPVY